MRLQNSPSPPLIKYFHTGKKDLDGSFCLHNTQIVL
nr:MAG TPA: hypothetical protein [Caudoviricetes sp.]